MTNATTARRKANIAQLTNELATRRYGVEIEMTNPSHSVVRDIRAAHAAVHGRLKFGQCHDGSVSGHDVEIMTQNTFRGALVDQPAMRSVRDMCDRLKAAGARVNHTCGIHVHVDASDLSLDEIKRVVKVCNAFQDVLHKRLRDASDFRGTNFAARWTAQERERALRATSKFAIANAQTNRYRGLNLSNVANDRKCTIEFRYFASSVDADTVQAYVTLCIGIVAYAKRVKRARSERVALDEASPKRSMNKLLIQTLWITGAEHKAVRHTLLAGLAGRISAARRAPVAMSRPTPTPAPRAPVSPVLASVPTNVRASAIRAAERRVAHAARELRTAAPSNWQSILRAIVADVR